MCRVSQSTSLPILGGASSRKSTFTPQLSAKERAPAICKRAAGAVEYGPVSPHEHLSASATYLEALDKSPGSERARRGFDRARDELKYDTPQRWQRWPYEEDAQAEDERQLVALR